MNEKTVGFVGLGDMGMAMAGNLIEAGFPLVGYDLREERLALLEEAGGDRATGCAEVGGKSDAVFVMVLNGEQANQVVSGPGGLLETLKPGATIIVSATISPAEVREVAAAADAKGVHLIDTPVSGGLGGAEAGTLTLMAAGKAAVLDDNRPVLEAVSAKIFHVGEEIGAGQTVKGALQALIGTVFAGIFESLVLGAKAGVKGETLYNVIASTGVGCPLFENCARLIMDRKFEGTGSHIGTMYKDLGLSLGMARENGVPMFATSAAFELFQAGISSFPEGDNWSIVKLLERIAGTEVKW